MNRDPNQPHNPDAEIDTSPAVLKPASSPSPADILKHIISMNDCARKYPDRDIYAMNNTKKITGQTIRIAETIITADGSETFLEIPITWLPIKLTASVSIQDILNSSRIRESIRKGALVLIDPDFAEELYLTEIGMTEAERISSMTKADLSSYGDLLKGKDTTNRSVDSPMQPQIPKEFTETEGVRLEIVNAVLMGDMAGLISALTFAQVSDDLVPEEVTYIKSKIRDPSVLALLS